VTDQLDGPKIQKDVALLIRLLWRLEGWEDPTHRSAMHATARFIEHIGGYESCPCSSCSSMVASSKTTAAILEPHIRALTEPTTLTSAAVQAAVYNLLGHYLCTIEKEDQ